MMMMTMIRMMVAMLNPDDYQKQNFLMLSLQYNSIWNFCTHSSDFILQGNQWWGLEMSDVFSGYGVAEVKCLPWLGLGGRIVSRMCNLKFYMIDIPHGTFASS